MNKQWLESFNLFLAKSCATYHNVLLCGDLNFPNIPWYSPELATSADEVQFTEILNDYYLSQLNLVPTQVNHVLDLVITNVPNQVHNMSVLSPVQSGLKTDHAVVTFDVQMAIRAAPKIKRTVFDYGRGDFDGLRSTLEAADLFNMVDPDDNVNSNWLKWKDVFLTAVDSTIPKKTIKNARSLPSINGEIIHAIRRKENLRRKLKSSSSDALKTKFKEPSEEKKI